MSSCCTWRPEVAESKGRTCVLSSLSLVWSPHNGLSPILFKTWTWALSVVHTLKFCTHWALRVVLFWDRVSQYHSGWPPGPAWRQQRMSWHQYIQRQVSSETGCSEESALSPSGSCLTYSREHHMSRQFVGLFPLSLFSEQINTPKHVISNHLMFLSLNPQEWLISK